MRTIWIGLMWGALFLASFAFASARQEPREHRAPSAAAQATKKRNVAVFALSGTPSPGKPWQPPKGVPKRQSLSGEEKLKIVQGVHGLPAVSASSGTPFLTLYPGHLFETTGNLELGWPTWDRLGIAYYNPILVTESDGSVCTKVAEDGHALLTFQADAGNIYLIDFLVVIEIPPASTAYRDFELTVSGLPASDQKAVVGGNHLTAVLYVQTSGYYTARLGLKPRGSESAEPSWGDWYFLATEVTKFVPAPQELGHFLLRSYRENPNGYLFASRNGNNYPVGKMTGYGLWPVQKALHIERTGLHAFRHAPSSELLE